MLTNLDKYNIPIIDLQRFNEYERNSFVKPIKNDIVTIENKEDRIINTVENKEDRIINTEENKEDKVINSEEIIVEEKKEEISSEVLNIAKNLDPVLQQVGIDDFKNVQTLLNKVRTQEKDKQHKELEKLKTLEKEKDKEIQSLKDILNKFNIKNNDNKENLAQDKTVLENNEQVLEKKIQDLYERKLKELDNIINKTTKEFNNKLTQIELDKYKEELLTKHPLALKDFVKGDSKEELEASVLSSVQLRKQIEIEAEQRKINEQKNSPTVPQFNPSMQNISGKDKIYSNEELQTMPLDQLDKLIKNGTFGNINFNKTHYR